jgi:large subunit ribosomal protein L19
MSSVKLRQVEKELLEEYKKDYPDFRVGDTIAVTYKIQEKDRSRLHTITGIVIKKQGKEHRKSFSVRRISYGEAMEVTFPAFSPIINKIEVVQKAKRKPRRARLYYLRARVGKKATTV